jgi:HlyD family secretion protein
MTGFARRFADRLPRLPFGRPFLSGEITLDTPRARARDAKPDLDDIFAEHPPRLVRDTHYGVAAIIVVLIVIASYVNIDIIVSASGRLIADAPTIVLQPMTLSVIRDIKVKPGDVVHKGDILATLDPTFTQADQGALQAQRASLAAQIGRLEAELDDAPIHLEASSPDAILQLTLYHQRQSEYRQRLRAFDEDEQRYKSTIVATALNSASLAQQIDIARQMETMHQTLFKKQIEAKSTYLDATVARMRAERDQQDAEIHLNESRHFLLSRQAERQVFIDQWRSQLLDELVKARKEAKSVDESLVKAERMNDLVALKAPEDGFVLDVGKRSVGSVLQAAEPLITLVPTNAVLIADVMIASNDVGYTKPGDEVVIKVDAFPYQRHGFLNGRLRAIGEDSSGPSGSATGSGPAGAAGGPPSGAFHRSQVALTDTKLQALQPGSHLIPGMTVTAEIKVGSRSIISYFLYPIMRGLDESIREP